MEFLTPLAGRNLDGPSEGPPSNAAPMDLDASVIARLQAGEVDALETCYRVFGARVRRLCRSLLGNRHDADDASQEVFLRVYEQARKFSGRSRFSTWVFRVTVNQCLHRLERERRRATEPLPMESVAGPPSETLRAIDERDAVEWLLRALEPPQRAVLLLREIEGLDYREIAEVLGVPVGTVMSRLYRARQRLIELGPGSRAAAHHPRSSVS